MQELWPADISFEPTNPITIEPIRQADLATAVELAGLLEPIANQHGFHIAVGGGTIHKKGVRKDIDILIYRRRIDIKHQTKTFELRKLFDAFTNAGLTQSSNSKFKNIWCTKFVWKTIMIDVLYPEAVEDGSYEGESNEEDPLRA